MRKTVRGAVALSTVVLLMTTMSGSASAAGTIKSYHSIPNRLPDGVGVTLLTNGNWHRHRDRTPLYQILVRLFNAADTL